jgi:hypothetical protein
MSTPRQPGAGPTLATLALMQRSGWMCRLSNGSPYALTRRRADVLSLPLATAVRHDSSASTLWTAQMDSVLEKIDVRRSPVDAAIPPAESRAASAPPYWLASDRPLCRSGLSPYPAYDTKRARVSGLAHEHGQRLL